MATIESYIYLSANMLGYTPSQPTNYKNSNEPGFEVRVANLQSVQSAIAETGTKAGLLEPAGATTASFFRIAGWQLNGNLNNFSNGQWWELEAYVGTSDEPHTDPNNWVRVANNLNPKPDLVQQHGHTANHLIFEISGSGGAHIILSTMYNFSDTPVTRALATPNNPTPIPGEVPYGTGPKLSPAKLNDYYQKVLDGVIPCFLAGTKIETIFGSVAIEELKAGDLVICANGGVTEVLWIGRRYVLRDTLAAEKLPVAIAPHTFGENLPNAELRLSPDHAIAVDEFLVNAGALINYETISPMSRGLLPTVFVYYHVETTAHEEILANNLPVETFIDALHRSAFDNYGEYLDRVGFDRVVPAMSKMRLSAQRQLPLALQARFGIAQETILETDLLLENLQSA